MFRINFFSTILILSAVFIFVSCGDSKNDPANENETTDEENISDNESPDIDSANLDKVIGGFVVKLNAPVEATETTQARDGYTSVLGKIYNGPTPQAVIWEAGTVSGDCTLYKPRVPFCEEPCGGSAVCVEDDICMDYPATLNGGVVTVQGIKTSDNKTVFTMKPVSNIYQSTDTHPFPAFDEGTNISFSAAGDAVKKFTIASKGIAPLNLLNETIPIEDSQPLLLKWNIPADKEISSIHVKMDISTHGGSKGKIECDTADDGELELGADIVDELVDLGVAGFPTVKITRSAVGNYSSEYGIITLTISSEVEKEVLIDGLVSCNEDEDCPDGETCQDDLTCG
jgi:hypothetical protein